MRNFTLVGITEELNLTVRVLERLLPGFFRGATQLYGSSAAATNARVTALENQLTGTRMAGAVSSRARELLMAHEATRANNAQEVHFYQIMRRRFWQRAVTALGRELPLDR